jgi:H+-transporting ATPase
MHKSNKSDRQEWGLTSAQVAEQRKLNGYNEIPEHHASLATKLVKNLLSPIAIMLIAASILSFLLKKDFDGYFILTLLAINIIITIFQESKADNAIKKLNETLEQSIKTLRDGKWQNVASRMLVEGDVIQLTSGEVVPADGRLSQIDHVYVNESSLTGESLPKAKNIDDMVFSGSFMSSGIATITITATGAKTSFGRTLFSVERTTKKSLLEKDIISISKFLTIFSMIAVVMITTILLINNASLLELLTLDLSLIIAGVPISLPTVMTLIIEFGVLALAKKDVIVRRLSALEDLANVNFLLTDKTGTLTKNKITVQDIYAYNNFTHDDVLTHAALLAQFESDNPIDKAILERASELKLYLPDVTKLDLIPADSQRKRSTCQVYWEGKNITLTLGAPQIVAGYCKLDGDTQKKLDREIELLAANGFRSLAIASVEGVDEKGMKLIGLLALSDTLRQDAKSVVSFLRSNGIGVAMVTGDNRAIAANIASRLEIDGANIITKSELDRLNWDKIGSKFFQQTSAFAEVLPEDKLKLVQKGKEIFTIASNGDGINDLPAVKAANVGIAVKNAVTALKSTADIVLLSEGISVIKDAIIESRKIFERIYTYSLYRTSESLRLIVTIAALGIIYGSYPMTALQIILLALLNDIPIISLAFNRVRVTNSPSKIDAKKRFTLSSLYGLVGIANSLLLFVLMQDIWRLDWNTIQTMFFLKLTISGHLLIYVAHTKERWWKFLPSKQVISATSLTQIIASAFAVTGFLMPGSLDLWQVAFVWAWAFGWMQVSEVVKALTRGHQL